MNDVHPDDVNSLAIRSDLSADNNQPSHLRNFNDDLSSGNEIHQFARTKKNQKKLRKTNENPNETRVIFSINIFRTGIFVRQSSTH